MMRRNKTLLGVSIPLFLAVEMTLSVLLHTAPRGGRILSYAVVALAFVFCLLLYRRSAVWRFTSAALLFPST